MDDYDSDDVSLQGYTETKVLLGYAETEPGSDLISHLGGEPIWPHTLSPADARLAKCACCNKLMPLLIQLNGAIPESPHDRMFYVFGCNEKTCRRKNGSVKALRGVKVAKDYELRLAKGKEEAAKRAEEKKRREEAATEPKAGDMLFGSGAGLGTGTGGNPFSTGRNPFSASVTAGAASPFSTKPTVPTTTAPVAEKLAKSFADTLRISGTTPPEPEPLLYGPSEPWPSPLPFSYPLFYFDADYETLAPDTPVPRKIEEVLGDDDKNPDSLPASNNDADDGHLDTVFQRFADRVGQNPEQVLRYERGGAPLLYSHADEVAKALLDSKKEFTSGRIPPCAGCGKRGRVFEFQLMPHAISVLEGDSVGLDGMEWGTVIVATCTCVPKARDANGVGWVEEWVGVQWEGQK